MELRRIQSTGGGTYIISLPKRWIKKYSLHKGDTFALIERDNGLFITPKFEDKRELACEIPVSDNIGLEIITRYMYGYNVVRISGTITNATRNEIKRTIALLVGFEIVDERENEIIIQDLLDSSELRVRKAMKREYFLVSTMHKDAIEALLRHDRKLAEDVVRRDLEVDKLYYLVVRQLRSAVGSMNFAEKVSVTPIECLDFRAIAKDIEDMGDAAEKIASLSLEIEEVPDKVREDIKEFSDFAFRLHSRAFDALYKNRQREAHAIIALQKKIDDMKEALEEKTLALSVKKGVIFGNIVDNLTLIAKKGVDIAYFVIKP